MVLPAHYMLFCMDHTWKPFASKEDTPRRNLLKSMLKFPVILPLMLNIEKMNA